MILTAAGFAARGQKQSYSEDYSAYISEENLSVHSHIQKNNAGIYI